MSKHFIVVDGHEEKIIHIEGVEIIAARDYLTDQYFQNLRSAKIFNLCNSYKYQGLGYYVSLLAVARKHRVIPDPVTIQDLKSTNMIKIFSDELDELIQRRLKNIRSTEFTLSVYFGKNITESYNDLARQIFQMVKCPLLKVEFTKNGHWSIKSIRPLSIGDIPEIHSEFFTSAASEYFKAKVMQKKSPKSYHYDLAILHNPQEFAPPSNEKALNEFIQAGKNFDINVELITKDDSIHLLEYDALFIRETTNVHHHTYRLARKAQAEGLVVMDDPESILKCSNKVFLEELLRKHNIPRPKTMILYEENIDQVMRFVPPPCILKRPDSAFSQGVHKAETTEEFLRLAEQLLSKSELIIVQEFLPSEFDWRIGILNERPLFACKYYMAKDHWQIVNKVGSEFDYGNFDCMGLEMVPSKILEVALKASNLIGKGLYGVDLKQKNDKIYLIEVNDNPNIDAGVEDQYYKKEIYRKIMDYFYFRLNKQRFLHYL